MLSTEFNSSACSSTLPTEVPAKHLLPHATYITLCSLMLPTLHLHLLPNATYITLCSLMLPTLYTSLSAPSCNLHYALLPHATYTTPPSAPSCYLHSALLPHATHTEHLPLCCPHYLHWMPLLLLLHATYTTHLSSPQLLRSHRPLLLPYAAYSVTPVLC